MISSNDWFEVINTPKSLSPFEQVLLKIGVEAERVNAKKDYLELKDRLLFYFENHHHIDRDKLLTKTKTRKAEIVETRQMIMHCLRLNTNASLRIIGDLFDKDHSTSSHSVKVINNLLEIDPVLRIKYCDMLKHCGMETKASRLVKKYNRK